MFADLIERSLSARLRRLPGDDRGAVTVWMVFWMIVFMALGGVAVDSSKAWRMKAMLQSAADAAAYAGAIQLIEQDGFDPAPIDTASVSVGDLTVDGQPVLDILDGEDPPDGEEKRANRGEKAIKAALQYAEKNLPKDAYGHVLRRKEVELGIWAPATRSFVPTGINPNAVRVTLRRTADNKNPELTSFLRLIGFDQWDIEVESVARAFRTPRADCGDPILTARTRLDVQETNIFVGICVHADVDVAVDTSADWLTETAAALVDELVLATLTPYQGAEGSAPVSGLIGEITGESEGEPLDLAGTWTGDVDGQSSLSTMAADLVAGAAATIDRDALDFLGLAAGATYHVTCNDDQVLSVPGGVPIIGIVLLSDCPIKMQQDATVTNSVFISNIEHLAELSVEVTAPTGVSVEPPENCLPGDGVRILVFTDAATAAELTLFDPEVFPLGNLLVAAGTTTPDPEEEIDLGVEVDLAGDLLVGAVVEQLLGICLGAEYLLEADAYALAR